MTQVFAETHGRVIRWARLYDLMVRIVALGREESLRKQTLFLAQLKERDQVLDVGCGTGTLLIAAVSAIPTLIAHGIDPSLEMIERAKMKAVREGHQIDFEVGAIEEINRKNSSVDVVLSSLMLHHLPPEVRKRGLSEVFRVLRPGGRFVVVDFVGAGPLLHRMGSVLSRSPASAQDSAGLVGELRFTGFDEPTKKLMGSGLLFFMVTRKPQRPQRLRQPVRNDGF